jgi:hypothetical protein
MITEVPDAPEEDTSQSSNTSLEEIYLKTGKKYKPVALKVRPILGELPEKFRIIRNIIGDPLEHLPALS